MNIVLCENLSPTQDTIETYSPFCLKVHRALDAAELPYTTRHADRPDAFKKWNPLGQIPVLLVDGEAISDSTRILHKIAELAPHAFDTSAEAWLWEDFADTALNGYLVAARWFDDRNWPLVRAAYFAKMPSLVRAIIVPKLRRKVLTALFYRDVTRAGADTLWQRFAVSLAQLEARAPANGYWLGERLSVADLAIHAQLHSLRTSLTPTQHRAIAQHARLTAYLDRVELATTRRPARLHAA